MRNRAVLRRRISKRALHAGIRMVVLVLLIVIAVASARAQRPAFEAATIKPNLSGNSWSSMPSSPGRLVMMNVTLKDLLMVAHQVRADQISGGPGWIDSNRYDLEARAEGNPSQQQMMLMLQTLLQNRFAVAFHRETRELPIYELTVARGGFKLQPLKEGGCIPYDPGKPAPGSVRKYSDFCGTVTVRGGTLDATNASMADLARQFSRLVGRMVVDKSGITGTFPVHLTFAAGDSLASPADSPAVTGPDIFTAIQEQLGLKLESAKAQLDVLVIEHAEKPSAN